MTLDKAGLRLKPEHIDDGTFGAWVLKCDPEVFDVVPLLSEGAICDEWSVNARMRTRVQLMGAGQRVLLWVSGRSPVIPRGFWASGHLRGTVEEGHVAPRSDDGWDPDALRRQTHWVPLHMKTLRDGLLATDLTHDPALQNLEVLRAPRVTPSWVTTAELTALAARGLPLRPPA